MEYVIFEFIVNFLLLNLNEFFFFKYGYVLYCWLLYLVMVKNFLLDFFWKLDLYNSFLRFFGCFLLLIKVYFFIIFFIFLFVFSRLLSCWMIGVILEFFGLYVVINGKMCEFVVGLILDLLIRFFLLSFLVFLILLFISLIG